MSCGETADAFQSSFITLLLQGRYYNVRNDTLTIRAADLSIVLVFTAAPSNPLLGSWIVDGLATAPNSVSVPLEGTNLTAVFRIKTVSGSSGCNSYQGPYTTNGKLAAIGPLAGTQIACPQDIMTQEQAFLKDMQGVGKVERRGDHATLSDLSGSLLVSLVRPSIEEASPSPSASASASPSASATPTTKPTPSATPSTAPTATPTATATSTPTATPTAPPTAPPTATPVASGTPAPTVVPPASLPPTATCQVVIPAPVGLTINVVYPASWFTVTDPAELACRYFDPAAITVPSDPSTLKTAVMIKGDPTITYQDALTAATDPANWNVLTNQPVSIDNLVATRLQATAKVATPDVAVGVTRYGYLVNAGGHALWIETIGTVGDPTYMTNMSVVDLITSQSTLAPTP